MLSVKDIAQIDISGDHVECGVETAETMSVLFASDIMCIYNGYSIMQTLLQTSLRLQSMHSVMACSLLNGCTSHLLRHRQAVCVSNAISVAVPLVTAAQYSVLAGSRSHRAEFALKLPLNLASASSFVL